MSWMEGWGRRTVAVTAWASALIVFGVWMLFQVPLEWVPEVELPQVRIYAAWPGSSPRAVERYVTAPIEQAVQRVPGTASVESISQEGTACHLNIIIRPIGEAECYIATVLARKTRQEEQGTNRDTTE